MLLAHRGDVWPMLLTMSLSGLMKPGRTPDKPNEYMLMYVDSEEYKPKDWHSYLFGEYL